jgi:hypothetical protein
MNARRLVLISLFCVAAWLAFFADKAPEPDPAPSTDARMQPAAERANDAVSTKPQQVTQTAPLLSILRLRERAPYVSLRGQPVREPVIFGSSTWEPPPPKAVQAPPKALQAPPLPYTYLGKKLEDGNWEVYLAAGENIRVVRPDTTLDGTYRIGKIVPPVLSLTYLPLAQVQTISIGILE